MATLIALQQPIFAPTSALFVNPARIIWNKSVQIVAESWLGDQRRNKLIFLGILHEICRICLILSEPQDSSLRNDI